MAGVGTQTLRFQVVIQASGSLKQSICTGISEKLLGGTSEGDVTGQYSGKSCSANVWAGQSFRNLIAGPELHRASAKAPGARMGFARCRMCRKASSGAIRGGWYRQ